ncbi:MAG: UDP-4-amino-4,6-dideoxy-N-acetyl-beta-L-altrosamine transaminase, partial [Bdellovibrionales bacterium]
MKPIPYGRQQITEEDKRAVISALESDFLTQGPMVDEFEKKFSQFVGANYAVAVTNGTAALHLAALALGVKPGDKILVTPNSFVASANCIRYCGGDVEFIDIDSTSYCIDLNLIEKKLAQAKPGTYKGIVAVDFAGYPLDSEKLRKIADKFGLWIIEDACHAVGAEFKNSQNNWVKTGSGSYADITAFSFHPVKHVATGEGGLLTTARPDLYEKLRQLRSHGIERDTAKMNENHGGWYYEMQNLGYNYRIPDLLCALGVSQLSRISTNLKRRREIAAIYSSELKDCPIALPAAPEEIRHAYHLYVIQTEYRKKLYEYLRENKILAQVHYVPIYKHPYYK